MHKFAFLLSLIQRLFFRRFIYPTSALWMLIYVMAAWLSLGTHVAAIDCKVLTLENQWYEGQLGRIVERPPSLMLRQEKGWKRFNCREIVQVSILSTPVTPLSTIILLRDGSKLYGEITGGDQQVVQFHSLAFGNIAIEIMQLQEIHFQPNLQPLSDVEKNKDTLYFSDGDKLIGSIESFSQGFVKIQHPRLGSLQEPFSKLERITIGEFKNQPKKSDGLWSVVIGIDGSELCTRIVRCEDEILTVQFSAKQQLRIQLNNIQLIFFQSNRFTYISDLPSDRCVAIANPRFSDNNSNDFQYQRDRNQRGGPLMIAGQSFYKGLGTFAPSKITISLQGEFQKFQTCIGIDDSVRQSLQRNRTLLGANVTFQIWVDEQKKFDSGTIRWNDPLQQVDIDVSNAKTMVLITLPSDFVSVNNLANWGGSRLVKKQ